MLLLVVQNPINLLLMIQCLLTPLMTFSRPWLFPLSIRVLTLMYFQLVHGTGDFSLDKISVSTILSHLSTLVVSKSTGPDGLSAAFLREVANEIAVLLTNLYNQSLLVGFIPVGWKQSHITPVYKGGKRDDPI